MAFIAAAPAVEAAAAGTAGSAASGAAASGAARGASTARTASASAPVTKPAPARARELRGLGQSRSTSKRKLRDEYGGTHAETEALLDDADASTTVEDAGQSSSDPEPAQPADRSRLSLPSLPSAPKAASKVANAGGGALLGAIAYVLALTYLREGKAGVNRWLKAKFLNRTDPNYTPPTTTRGPQVARPGKPVVS